MVPFCQVSWKKVVALAIFLGALGNSVFAQTFNIYEGQGVLENAWQDWSWCTRSFNSTSYVYQGNSSIQVTYAGAYQGFELESPVSFPAGDFESLDFAINGGPNASRSINLSLSVNGSSTKTINLNKFIKGGSVAANAWRSVAVPIAAFGLKATDQISAILLQEASGQAQPPFWIGHIGWMAPSVRAPFKVSINANTSIHSVDPKHFGVNTDVWVSNFTTAANTALIAQSGFKAFRFPAGSASDTYDWTTGNNIYPTTYSWSFDFDQWAAVAVPATGGQSFITANYGTGTPQEAAAWVKYSNITKKYGMKYWEIGNEVYGSWETDTHARANDPVIYATQFAQYYQQMKAVDPTIQVGAVSTPGEDNYANYSDEVVTNPVTGQKHSGWTAVMLSTMASLGVAPDYIIYHRYPEYQNECDYTLMICNSSWSTDMADLRKQLNDYLGTVGAKTQIMCTENNCDAGPEGKQMCSLVNGLFLADSFGAALQTECNSFVWWDWINGQNSTADNGSWLYGWRMYGDEGIVSPDLSQTYPVFYAEQLLNQFATSGDEVFETTSSYDLLSAFTTKRSDGSVRVMVINKNPTEELAAQFTFTGFTPTGPVSTFTYGIAQDNLAKNGKPQTIGTGTIKSWPKVGTASFPPYSITVLEFTNHK